MQPHFRLYEYEFELKVKHCDIVTRIPCFYSLLWRLEKRSVSDSRRSVAVNNRVQFKNSLKLTGQMLWNDSVKKFFDKKSFLTLNLAYQNKPDDLKFAGSVTIQLAQFLNTDASETQDVVAPLQRCTDKNGQITYQLSFNLIKQLPIQEYQDNISLAKIAAELSSIGKAPSVVSSEAFDLNQFHFGGPNSKPNHQESDNKRINSLTRATKLSSHQTRPRVSMQPPRPGQTIFQEPQIGGGLRKVQSGDLVPAQIKGLSQVKSDNRLLSYNNIQQTRNQSNSEDLFQKLQSLKEVNEELQKQNDMLRKQNISLQRLNQQLSFDVQELQRRFQKSVSGQLETRRQNQLIFGDYNRMIEKLKKQLAAKDKKISDFTQSSIRPQDSHRVIELEGEVAALSAKLEQQRKALQNHDRLVKGYYQMEAECHRIQQQYDHSEQQVWDLTISSKQKDKQLKNIQKTILDYTKQLQAYEKQYNAAVEQNNRLNEYCQNFEDQLCEQQDIFMKQLEVMRQIISQSVQKQEQTIQTIAVLQNYYIKMSEALAHRAQNVAYFENRLNDLQKEVNQMNLARQTKSYRDKQLSLSNSQMTVSKQGLKLGLNEFQPLSEKDKSELSEPPGQMPTRQKVVGRRFDRAAHRYSSTQLELLSPTKTPQGEVELLLSEIACLTTKNQQLTEVIEGMKRKQQKLDSELQMLRASGFSKKGTQATEDQQDTHGEWKYRNRKQISYLQTVPEHQRSMQEQVSIMKEKVEIQEKIREISVEIQKLKLTFMKSTHNTTQVQQLIASIKPLQEKVFELLSSKKGVLSCLYSRQQ